MCVIFRLTVLFSLMVCGMGTLRGYPRPGRSSGTQLKVAVKTVYTDVFHRCSGYTGFQLPPPVLTSPDSGDNVTLILTPESQWILRDSSTQPDPLFPDDLDRFEKSVHFCLGGNRKLGFSYKDDGYSSLEVLSLDEPKFYSNIDWEFVSSVTSTTTGNPILEAKLYAVTPYINPSDEHACCGFSLVDNVLTTSPIDCQVPCLFQFDTFPVLYLHAVKFSTDCNNSCGDCWIGLFTLCSNKDCNERVTAVLVNNEIIPLLPIVITLRCPDPPDP